MSRRYEFDDEHLKLLIYGEPGSGKTRLAATAAMDERLAPVLMLEAFGNPLSIRDYEKKPDIISLEAMEDFNDPYYWLRDGQDPEDPYCKAFKLNPPYKTLIVDGLTEVQRYVIRKVSGVDNIEPGNLTAALGRQGFGQMLGTMLNWAVHYIQLDMNVILTSLQHNKTVNDIAFCQPLIWGQSGNEICGYVHAVARLTTQLAAPKRFMGHPDRPVTMDANNVAMFRETATYYAKNQYNVGVEHLVDPIMSDIMDLIE